MTRRIFEFVCPNNHRNEALVSSLSMWIKCPECDLNASRVISAVRSQLEGITGAFPTAYDAWARKHEEATKVARKRNEGNDQ